MRKAIVVNEQILGLLIEGTFPYVEVLKASILRGAPMGVYTLPIITTEYRPATKKDFDDYGVLWNSEWVVAHE